MKDKHLNIFVARIEEAFLVNGDVLDNFHSLPVSEQTNQIQKLEVLRDQIENDLLDLETNMAKSKYKNLYTTKKDELEKRFAVFQEKLATIRDIFFHGSGEKEDEDPKLGKRATNAHLIAMGDQIGQEALDTGEEALEKLRQANRMMMDMEEEVFEQRLKLLRIRDNINESQSLTNRSKEALNYFSKVLAKDKLIRILVVVMAILLIGIFIFMFGFSGLQIEIKDEETKKDVKLYSQYGIYLEEGEVKADVERAYESGDYLEVLENKLKNKEKKEKNSNKTNSEVVSTGSVRKERKRERLLKIDGYYAYRVIPKDSEEEENEFDERRLYLVSKKRKLKRRVNL